MINAWRCFAGICRITALAATALALRQEFRDSLDGFIASLQTG